MKVWNNIIEQYIEIEKFEWTKQFIGYPKVLKIIREKLSDLKKEEFDLIIDFGCGSGGFTRKLKKFSKMVIGIDISMKALAYAIKNNKVNGVEYILMDKEGNIEEKADIVVSNFVVLTIDKKNIIRYFEKANKYLRTKGYFIILTVHPAFYEKNFSSFKKRVSENFNYYKKGERIETILFGEKMRIKFFDYHYNNEHITDFLYTSGFVIEKIYEPKPDKRYNKVIWKDELNYPPLIIYLAKKWRGDELE